MNIYQQISTIVADKSRSVSEKVDAIVQLHQAIDPDSHEFNEVGAVAYAEIRQILLNDNYEDCHTGELLMCNTLLAESYFYTQRHWLIAPLAQHCYDMMVYIETDDEESVKMMIGVTDRFGYMLRGSGHPRLSMRLYALLYKLESSLPEPNTDALKDAAEELVTLATLTQCDTYIAPLREEITTRLGAATVSEIEQNPYTGVLAKDPVEYSEEYEAVIDQVDAEVDKQTDEEPYFMGKCFEMWRIKQNILAEKYSIEWKTPSEMNPDVTFD